MKGWPDRSAAVRIADRVEELFFLQLSVRLTQLVSQSGSNHGEWKEYTSNAKVHARLQDGWTEHEEQTLRSSDTDYCQRQREIAELQATADPGALEEPYRMAKRDPEFIAAAWQLSHTVYALDQELAL
jgi:hypothetical protein